MAWGVSENLWDCLKICLFFHFCLQAVQQSAAAARGLAASLTPRLRDMHGVFSDPSPSVGVKTPLFKFGSLPLACTALCLTCPCPANLAAALPSPPTGTVPSIPRPAPRLTRELRAGLQPHGQAEQDQGCRWPWQPSHGAAARLCCVPPGSLHRSVLGSGWCRGWPRAGTMARFSALPKRRGWAGACVPTLCLLPRTRGCSAQLGHPQHSDTSHGEGGTCFERLSVVGDRALCLGITVAGGETISPFPPASAPAKQSYRAGPSFLLPAFSWAR